MGTCEREYPAPIIEKDCFYLMKDDQNACRRDEHAAGV